MRPFASTLHSRSWKTRSSSSRWNGLSKRFFCFGNKRLNSGRVFLAWCRFHTAGGIHRIRPREPNGLSDILRRQAASENQRQAKELVSFLSQPRPIEHLTGAAVIAGSMSIEERGDGL